MLKSSIICLLAITFMLLPITAQAKVSIFACEPEWKALSEEIGGDLVKAFSATSAFQDPHYIRAKPSLVAKMRRADLLICSGSDLEVGWLPILLAKANKNIQVGRPGYLMASDFVTRLDQPKKLDRSMGDVHAQGNPHIHLNPYNILLVALELNNRLQKIDPDNAADYQRNYEDFVSKWSQAIREWEFKAEKLKDVKVLPYHKTFSYLIDWLGLDEVATLEVKPGISPTLNYLESLLISLRLDPVQLIIRTPFDPDDASNWVANKTQIKQLVLPYTVGGNDQSYDLFSLFDNSINLMLGASQ